VHTATQLADECFDIDAAGRPASVDEIMDWRRGDRFGIVVTEPLGGLGASLLIQAAVTAFWNEFRRSESWPPTYGEIYPDLMVFHVGRGWGELSSFDFWPEDREVVVEAGPAELLRAVGLHAITHLAVPEGREIEHDHRAPQLGPVQRRLRDGFVYSPSGRVGRANLSISASNARAQENVWAALHPREAAAAFEEEFGDDPEFRRYEQVARQRGDEVPDEQRLEIEARRRDLVSDGRTLETYRTSAFDETLRLLNAAAGVTSPPA
jgi:hypothetical protein